LRRAANISSSIVEMLAAFVVLGRTEWLLRRSALPEVAARVGVRYDPAGYASSSRGISAAPDPPVLRRWESRRVWATRQVSRVWPFGDTCLRRALVEGQRLRHRRPSLVLGVRTMAGETVLHAWLEIDGHSLDSSATGYAVLGAASASP
jgi:hypothetical protein